MIKQTEQPLVSVIMPVFNDEKFLIQAIESIVEQTHSNFELIAVDDASSDKSFGILESYARCDKRFKVSCNIKRYGLHISLNRALKEARGKFIAFMDAKDLSHPHRLKEQLYYLQTQEKVVAVGTQAIFLDEYNKKVGKSDYLTDATAILKRPLHGMSFQFENFMVNKYRIPKDLLSFRASPKMFLYADMTIRLLKYGQIVNLSKYLYFRRQGEKPMTQTPPQTLLSVAKVWLRSMTLHNFRPPLKLFLPTK